MTSTQRNLPERKRREYGNGSKAYNKSLKSNRAEELPTTAGSGAGGGRISTKLATLRKHLGQGMDNSDMAADDSNENLDVSLDLETAERHKVRLICSDDILPTDLEADLDDYDDLLQDESSLSDKDVSGMSNFMDKILADVSRDKSLRFDERVQKLLYMKLHNYVDSLEEDNWKYEGGI